LKFGIGQPVTRLEDPRLLTGGGRYTDDIAVDDMAHGYVMRAPHAHAEIVSIDVEAARQMPGVLAVLTAAEVEADGLGVLPCLLPLQNRDGTPAGETPRPLLAGARVRHVGEPVVFVVAESVNQARDAAETVEIDYDERPAVTDTRHAGDDGQPQIWDAIPNNTCFDWDSGDADAVAAAFAQAALVSRLELVNNRVVSNAMEPRAVLADYDPADDRSTLYTPSQGVHILHPQLTDQVLKLDKDKLRVVSYDVGGGFGTRAFLYPEHCLALWASRRLQRPVKWTGDRTEIFLSDAQARDNVSLAELALDADGKFLALRVTTHAAMGAYLHNFGPFIPTQAGTHMVTGLYAIPHAYVRVKGMLTNTVPTDAYRGAGRPEGAYLIERLVDYAAAEVGLTPDEIRRRNFVPAAAMPYNTALGNVYDSGDFLAVMEEGLERADWADFEARRAEAAARGRLRGIGLSGYIERCGGGNPETAQVQFDADQDGLAIVIGNQHNGQGHLTMYTQIICDRLGIAPEQVRLQQGDSDRVPWGMTGGSRAAPVGGAAVLGAADQVIEKGRLIAAHMLEAAAVDVEYADASFRVAGTDRRLGLFEVVRAARDPANLPDGVAPGLDADYTRTPEAATFPNGCHVVELEVDPDTGQVEIARYTIVDDFGDVINPLLLAGQVHGGIAQGLGQALTEHTVYDPDSGQLLTATFMDYAVPRADDLPSFAFSTHNVRCTTNPLGIKGAGEAGTIGAMPAVINALVDALRPATGGNHIDMPATPQHLWQLLQQARAA